MNTNVINNWTIGSDFELFLFNKQQNEVINAKPYVKGTKHKPFNFDKSSPFWCTSLDNISFEGNIAPCTTANDFSNGIEKVISYLKSNLPADIVPIHDCAVRVSPKYLNTKEARTLGCEPTLNAYTLDENPRPSGETTNLRTCCTHVHLKFDGMDFATSVEWVKAMDLWLGMPSLLIEPSNERRLLYGTLGEMRYCQTKTVEYRVLSSYFSGTRELREWVFNNTVKAIEWVNQGHRVTDEMSKSFQKAMIDGDLNVASQLISEFNISMPQ